MQRAPMIRDLFPNVKKNHKTSHRFSLKNTLKQLVGPPGTRIPSITGSAGAAGIILPLIIIIIIILPSVVTISRVKN